MSDQEHAPSSTPGLHIIMSGDEEDDAKPYQEAEVARAIWRSENIVPSVDDLPESPPAPQHYSLIIRWSEADNCFVAWVPEFGTGVKTHGATYAEAAAKGAEVIEMMSDDDPHDLPLPHAWVYEGPVIDEKIGQRLLSGNIHYSFAASNETAEGTGTT